MRLGALCIEILPFSSSARLRDVCVVLSLSVPTAPASAQRRPSLSNFSCFLYTLRCHFNSILSKESSMFEAATTGSEFKKQLRDGQPKIGLFLNSHSPTVAEQLAHSGYDWLLVDSQHGPMGYEKLSAMLSGISNGGAKSLVRVTGYSDRAGIQQSLDMGADGVLVPYINTAEEARQAVSCCRYPTVGTRSVYFPQRSMNKGGLLGYAGAWNDNAIVALQVETASCIENMEEIAAVPDRKSTRLNSSH